MLKYSVIAHAPRLSRQPKPLIPTFQKRFLSSFNSLLANNNPRNMSSTSTSTPTASNADASEKNKVPRLTELSLGGGCGCKISPGKLQEILKRVHLDFAPDERLLVGAGGSDDAAVYKISDDQAVVVTTDFFMPIVDDPADFGSVAAANAISDVYAMGGRPLLALSVLGMPVSVLPTDTIQRILNGGVDICRAAGIPLAGGHSIDSREPIFGLVVTGSVRPDRLRRNNAPRAGDSLILTKPLGAGVLTTACRKGQLDERGYRQVMCSMLQLNCLGAELVEDDALAESIHAMTDVTGFGLLGHLLEMVRAPGTAKGRDAGGASAAADRFSDAPQEASNNDKGVDASSTSNVPSSSARLRASIRASAVPFMDSAADLSRARMLPGAVSRNWASYGDRVVIREGVEQWQRDLLCDPQTSGGLLIAVAPGAATQAVLAAAAASHRRQTERRRAAGGAYAGELEFEARVIGTVVEAANGEDAGVVEVSL